MMVFENGDNSLIDEDFAADMLDEFYYQVAEAVSRARKQKGFRQEDLAQLVGINRVTLTKFENHKKLLGNKTLSRLFQELGLKVKIIES